MIVIFGDAPSIVAWLATLVGNTSTAMKRSVVSMGNNPFYRSYRRHWWRC
jgi:hypothetical protein